MSFHTARTPSRHGRWDSRIGIYGMFSWPFLPSRWLDTREFYDLRPFLSLLRDQPAKVGGSAWKQICPKLCISCLNTEIRQRSIDFTVDSKNCIGWRTDRSRDASERSHLVSWQEMRDCW